MAKLRRVFICHSHTDHLLAKAFEDALRRIFKKVHVEYSSSRQAGAGPQAGKNWLDWIHDQICNCQEALVLWTPGAARSSWTMWEAGAVSGISLATEKPASHKPVSLIHFGISPQTPPDPFVAQQVVDGMKQDSLEKLFRDLMWRHGFRRTTSKDVNAALKGTIPPLLKKIRSWLGPPSSGPAVTVLPRKNVITLAEQLARTQKTIHVVTSTGMEFSNECLEAVERQKLRLECLLLDPHSEAATLWARAYLKEDRKDEIVRGLLRIYTLPDAEVRLSKAYITNSMCATDMESDDGLMVVNFHVFGDETGNRPFLELQKTSNWHQWFSEQFKRLWDREEPFRLGLAASGMTDRGNGLWWFPFSPPAAKYGVLLDYNSIIAQFSKLARDRDLIRRDDLAALRARLWPILGRGDLAEIDNFRRWAGNFDIQERRPSPYLLVNLDRLHFSFKEDDTVKPPIEILRFPELLAMLERCDYRPPRPFFIADAAEIPDSLQPVDFHDSSELPKKWSMSECRCCRDNKFTVKFYVGPQRIVQCDSCKLEMANPQPHVLDHCDSFSKYATSRPHHEPLQRKAREYAEIFVGDIKERGCDLDCPLVEFGSASGDFLHALAEAGLWKRTHLKGLDICKDAVQCVNADIEQMPPKSYAGRYHYVVMINTIEHFQDPLKVLKTAHHMLAPNGQVFVANVPNSMSVNATVFAEGFISRNFFDGQHLFHFDCTSFADLCRRAGFSVKLLGKRKDIVHGQFDLAAKWIAHQCGVDLRRKPDFPTIVNGLKKKLRPKYPDLARNLNPGKPEDLVEFWREHVWQSPERSDCFDAWLTVQ